MRFLLANLVFAAVLWMAVGGRCEAASYRVDATADELNAGWRLRVFSITQDEGAVRLRVGFANESGEEVSSVMDAGMDGLRLASQSGSVDVTLEWVQKPQAESRGVAPGEVAVGELRGSWTSASSITAMPLTLRCTPFPPVTFTTREDRLLTPVSPAKSGTEWELDFEEKGVVEAMANIAMVLRAGRVKDDCLELGVAFRNGSRFGLTWRAGVSGRDARLLTWEGEVTAPLAVSEGLKDGIAPQGKTWRSGEEVEGTIRFPLPDPLAGQEIRFAFPGYDPVNMLFDLELGHWVTAPRARQISKVSDGAERARAEEGLFQELVGFWDAMSDHLAKRDYATYQAPFVEAGGVRAAQMHFVAGLSSLPVTSLEFHLPARQRLNSPGGEVRGLKLELRYQLAGIPRSNEFVALMECDMERRIGGGNSWSIRALRHQMRPPFWTLGFTEVKSSEHFLVFHKEDANSEEKAALAIRQMERAYDHLQKEGIPMGPRYAGFVIPDGADFSALTGRDPVLYSGASSATYVERDGALRVINQALFINDYRFFSMRRLWGRQDREVTIQHELLHLALADQTRPWTPAWLVEGAAVVFGGQMKDIQSRAPKVANPADVDLAALSQLPSLGVGVTDGDRVLSQYLHSARVVDWILKNRGKPDLLALYASFSELSPEEWRSGSLDRDGVRRQTITESPAMQAARLRLTEEMVRRHLSGMGLAELDVAAGGE